MIENDTGYEILMSTPGFLQVVYLYLVLFNP